MSTDGEPLTILSEDESWHLLASMALGRLVTSVEGQPQIFPVNYVVQRRRVLFRTAEGTKLFSAVINNRVAFEADEHSLSEGWSVIVKGRAQVLNTSAEIEEAERAHLLPWTAMVKRTYVRVFPSVAVVSGSDPNPTATDRSPDDSRVTGPTVVGPKPLPRHW